MDDGVKLTIDLSKNDIMGAAYIIGVEKPEELWENMKSQTILYPTEQLSESERKTFCLAMASVAIGVTLKQAGMWK